jgi:hypothetical protein
MALNSAELVSLLYPRQASFHNAFSVEASTRGREKEIGARAIKKKLNLLPYSNHPYFFGLFTN